MENSLILQSTECFHKTHKSCFLNNLLSLVKKGKPICCPKDGCEKIVAEYEFNQYLGQQREEYDKIMMANFIKDNPDLV